MLLCVCGGGGSSGSLWLCVYTCTCVLDVLFMEVVGKCFLVCVVVDDGASIYLGFRYFGNRSFCFDYLEDYVR